MQEPEKPDCDLIGQNGNIFNLVGIAARTLREHGLKDQAKEMTDRVFASGSYGEALCIIGEYVNITDSYREHRPSVRGSLEITYERIRAAGRIPTNSRNDNTRIRYGKYIRCMGGPQLRF